MAGGLTAVGSTIGTVGQYFAGEGAAQAAGSAAMAQQGASQKAMQDIKGYGDRMQAAGAPSALELSTMRQQLATAGTQLERQQKLFDSVDPALMESGKQALALLQGKNAQSIAPMLAQRQVQRQQLMQQLQQQLGPGGASSSAGAQALANFDMQTSQYQAGLQQQALGTLLGQANFGAQSAHASGQAASGLFGQVGSLSNAVQTRSANSIFNAGQMYGQAAQNVIGNAGAPWVQELASQQNKGQMFGQLGKLGGQWDSFIQNSAKQAMSGGMGGVSGGAGAAGSAGYGAGDLSGGMQGGFDPKALQNFGAIA